MPISLSCPTCGKRLKAPDEAAGKTVTCPKCSCRMTLPTSEPVPRSRTVVRPVVPEEREYEPADEPPRPSRRSSRQQADDDYEEDDEPARTKYCHECGRRIRTRAEICPKCGVRQPDSDDGPRRSGKSRDGVKVPVLISAISNIVVGLIWASTCFGIVFTIPMVILCIFEFALWSKADSLSPRRLGGQAKSLAIFEIVVGLVNTPTLICGIIVLINSGKLAGRDYEDHEESQTPPQPQER